LANIVEISLYIVNVYVNNCNNIFYSIGSVKRLLYLSRDLVCRTKYHGQ